jgi:hypothetical protein
MSSNSDMKDLSSTNLFGVVTWFAALVSLPIALFLEGTSRVRMDIHHMQP